MGIIGAFLADLCLHQHDGQRGAQFVADICKKPTSVAVDLFQCGICSAQCFGAVGNRFVQTRPFCGDLLLAFVQCGGHPVCLSGQQPDFILPRYRQRNGKIPCANLLGGGAQLIQSPELWADQTQVKGCDQHNRGSRDQHSKKRQPLPQRVDPGQNGIAEHDFGIDGLAQQRIKAGGKTVDIGAKMGCIRRIGRQPFQRPVQQGLHPRQAKRLRPVSGLFVKAKRFGGGDRLGHIVV